MAAIEETVTGGVSFALTDEQKELRALAREFASREIRPRAAEHDVDMRPGNRLPVALRKFGLLPRLDRPLAAA